MVYYMSFLALGDNLISLYLLSKVNTNVKIHILGTKNTENIAKLIGVEDKFNISVVFDDIPAFYDIKKRGIFKAVKDFIKFIIFIWKSNINILIFEKKDFRTKLIKFFTNIQIFVPRYVNNNVYIDRKNIIENIFTVQIHIHKYTLQLKNPKIIVINPLSRVKEKNIKNKHLKYILNLLNKENYIIYLIDIDKKYSYLQNFVSFYLTDTTLYDVKTLINKSDLYIGADSFLIHLTYYLQKNYFILFYKNNDDFMPPNINNDFYIKVHKSNDFFNDIKQKFCNIGLVT